MTFDTGMALGALAGALLGIVVSFLVCMRILHGHKKIAPPLERLAEIGAMTGGLAHEIKNPLSTIGLNAQLLQEAVEDLDVPQEDAQRLAKRVATLRREVDRLSGILDDFLRYAGELHLDRKPTDLRNVLEELADFFLPQAPAAGARIETDLPDAPVVSSIDVAYIKQAMLNLLLNATHALAKKPPIGQPARITLSVSQKGDEAVITVRDNGPGISAEQLDRVFAPYFTTRPGGAGLGLPITRRIIEAHDGRISVSSEARKGATFTIELPVRAADGNAQ
jgi:signal transduction histidine kinase